MQVPNLECIYCGGEMEFLPPHHMEYYLLNMTYDGTRRWFLCSKCGGVFGKDKVTDSWKLSPETYTRFVTEGRIKDKLND